VVKDNGDNVRACSLLWMFCQNPKDLVVDCLTRKTPVSPDCGIEEAILIMQREQTDVLSVQIGNTFEGLVLRMTLSGLSPPSARAKTGSSEEDGGDSKVNEELKVSRQVLQGIFDSTDSIIFLIDREYKITFYNKKAKESS